MLGVVLTSALNGACGLLITAETHVSRGLPTFIIVGLPDSAVRESRVRVEAALKNSGFALLPRRVLVNLAPADVKKEGAAFDLAIALSVLSGMELISLHTLRNFLVVGELALDGSLRPVNGAIIYAKLCHDLKLAGMVVPIDNLAEAAAIPGLIVYGAHSLSHLAACLKGEAEFVTAAPKTEVTQDTTHALCLSQVKGMSIAKRALEIAAIGGHHLLISGAPGLGKTMLCERMPTLLPDMTEERRLEVMALYSVSNDRARLCYRPPFRAPHHSLSTAALIGGGSIPKPGEISLAHGGVLFLDEFLEFSPDAINALRQPMESGVVNIARIQRRVSFSAHFQLLAASNPCPCGYAGHPLRSCRCHAAALEKYRAKLNGPIADRFDLRLSLHPEPLAAASESAPLTSAEVKARVLQAREFAKARGQTVLNRDLSGEALQLHGPLGESARRTVEAIAQKLCLSHRAVDRMIRVARSIADLNQKEAITESEIAQALLFRHDDTNRT